MNKPKIEKLEKLDYKKMYLALRTKVFEDKRELHELANSISTNSGDIYRGVDMNKLSMRIKKIAYGLGVFKNIKETEIK